MPQLILASASPRRHTLLEMLAWPFSVQVAEVDEDVIQDANPAVNVQRRAELKAQALSVDASTPPTLIIAADTTVALGHEMLNKPADAAEARHMLQMLRGRTHHVHTAITLRHHPSGRVRSVVDTAVVHMRPYTDRELETYIRSGDPLDKAGAYAIQHPVFKPVEKLEGCYLTVMGLSLCKLLTMFQEWSLDVTVDPTKLHQAHRQHSCPYLK